MSTRASGARFRQRKLNPKHVLAVVNEDDIGDLFGDEDDPSRHIPQVETGVEKTEEAEHHLQAVISATAAASLGGKVAQIYIPTPEAKSSSIKYDDLYPKSFAQPTTYIRFSSTVEDCIGTPYCMDEEDETFLKSLSNGKSKTTDSKSVCDEDTFEALMSFFEETAQVRQPFAAVDNPPVLSFEDIQASYDDTVLETARTWAERVYPHWRARRVEKGNRALTSDLKIETGQETDDADAYVCFRRREVRLARKTRGRDAQVVEKLKKLRRELEDARQLVHLINQREKLNSERIETDRKVFEQRGQLKRLKIDQNIQGSDEDLLVNQKPAPKPKARAETSQRPTTLRLSTSRVEPRMPENDLVQLADIKHQSIADLQQSVETQIAKHREWNEGFLDETWHPLTPPVLAVDASVAGMLPQWQEVQLPTPPASVKSGDVSETPVDGAQDAAAKPAETDTNILTPVSDEGQEPTDKTVLRLQKPSGPSWDLPCYRRRYGRNGVLYVEEQRKPRVMLAERCRVIYDSDDDDGDGDAVMQPVDYHDVWNINYRASLMGARNRGDLTAIDAGVSKFDAVLDQGMTPISKSHSAIVPTIQVQPG